MTTRLLPLTPPYDPEIDEALQRLMGRAGAEPLALCRAFGVGAEAWAAHVPAA